MARGAPYKWRVLAGSTLGAAIVLALLIASAKGETAKPAVARGDPSTATLVATVDVADLPPPTRVERGALPFLARDPAAFPAAKAAAGGPGAIRESTEGVGAKPTLTRGTQLAGSIDFANDPCGCTPPDMALGVGNGFKMQQVNRAGRIWDANNDPAPIFDLSSFYATGSDLIQDPWVLFDQTSQRWFAGIVDLRTLSERLAVSTSPSPASFNVYDIPQGSRDLCGAQAKIRVSDDVVAISANVRNKACFGDDIGVRITVLNKSQLIAGAGTVDAASFGPMRSYFSLVPAQSMTSTSTQWYAGLDNPVFSRVAHIVRTEGTPPAPVTLTEVFTPSIKRVSVPPDAEQKGTIALLTTGDSRVDNVVWQDETLIFTSSTACIPADDTRARSCVRLISTDTSTGAIEIDRNQSQK